MPVRRQLHQLQSKKTTDSTPLISDNADNKRSTGWHSKIEEFCFTDLLCSFMYQFSSRIRGSKQSNRSKHQKKNTNTCSAKDILHFWETSPSSRRESVEGTFVLLDGEQRIPDAVLLADKRTFCNKH